MKSSKKIFSLLLLSFVIIILSGQNSYSQTSDKKVKYKTLKLKAAVKCNNCKHKIEKALVYEKGIKEAEADVVTKIVIVKYKPDIITPKKIEKIIDDLGLNATILPAKKDCKKKCESKT